MTGRPGDSTNRGRRISQAEHQDHSQPSSQLMSEKAVLIAALLISIVPFMGPLSAHTLLNWAPSSHAWSKTIGRLYLGAFILLALGAIILSAVFAVQIWEVRSEDGKFSSVFSSTPGLIVVGLQYGFCTPVSWIFVFLAWKEYKKVGGRQNRDSTQDRHAVPLEEYSSSAAEDPPRRSSSRSSRRRASVVADRDDEEGAISSSSEVGSPVTRGSPWERLGHRRDNEQGGGNAVGVLGRSRSQSRRASSTRSLVNDPHESGSPTRPAATYQNPFDTSEEEPDDRRDKRPAFLGRRKEPASFV